MTRVLGPWANGRALNVFTGGVIGVLVMLSLILTASVFYPNVSETAILNMLIGGSGFTALVAAELLLIRRDGRPVWTDRFGQMVWRMPPLDQLPRARLTPLTRLWLGILRFYLGIAGGLVFGRIIELALLAHHN